MLSIGKLAGGAEGYYLRAVASGVEGYYLGSGEAPGRWVGAGSVRLGLAGVVSPEQLRAVLDGRDPATGKSLLWVRRPDRLPGLDLTFSAPKSVSLLFALGDEQLSADGAAGARRGGDPGGGVSGAGGRGGPPRQGRPGPAARRRVRRGGVPSPHVAGRGPAAAHPRAGGEHDPGGGRALVGAGREAAVPAGQDRRHPVPGGAARPAAPPRPGLGAQREWHRGDRRDPEVGVARVLPPAGADRGRAGRARRHGSEGRAAGHLGHPAREAARRGPGDPGRAVAGQGPGARVRPRGPAPGSGPHDGGPAERGRCSPRPPTGCSDRTG